MYFGCGRPCFRNFNSTIPVDVIRVKSYVNSFLDPTYVPARISINKPDLIPDRIVAGLVGVLIIKSNYLCSFFVNLYFSPIYPQLEKTGTAPFCIHLIYSKKISNRRKMP